MGLTVSLSNALAGMSANQNGLAVVSRNVANAGTPGYHRQSVILTELYSTGSSIRTAGVQRAFSEALQGQYTSQVGRSGAAEVRLGYLERLQSFLGMPGDAGSLDSVYGDFENALQALSVSPDDATTRSQALRAAQGVVSTLNRLSTEVQSLRKEAESEIAAEVASLNRMLGSLAQINQRLLDQGSEPSARAGLMDERDRLVAGISELVDTRVDYRADGTVALATTSGVGLLDNEPSIFSFEPAGSLSAASLYDSDPAESGVGSLKVRTPAGMELDLVRHKVLQSGRLAALVEMRDQTLVEAQQQLDEIAAGFALALSTVETVGDPATVGPASGLSVDLANMQAGNSFRFTYTDGAGSHTVEVVRVDDPSLLPMDGVNAKGERVIGLDFSGGVGAVATALDGLFGPDLDFANPGGSVLQVLDDGAAGTTDVTGLVARTTVTANQGQGAALSLFTDRGNAAYTGSLDGGGQKLGFAARIQINSAILADNRLLVQAEPGASLGDETRPLALLEGLRGMEFLASTSASADRGIFRLNGTLGQMIGQMMEFQGASVESAQAAASTQQVTLEALSLRMDDAYGVNMDEEMARLIELQNAYAANARVVSIVQELLNALMAI